ncbi:MAG: hypothetical protein FJ399_12865 [Verrucomicrobia bacterium]|nr:hypothetical protein [Verrucomicrobiota bacterium]
MSTARVDIEFNRRKPSTLFVVQRRTVSCVRATLTLQRGSGAPVVQGSSGRLYVTGATKIKFHFPHPSPYYPEGIEFDQKRGSNDRRGERNFPRAERVKETNARPRWIQVDNTYDDLGVWDYFILLKATDGSPGDFVIDPDIENTDVLPILPWIYPIVLRAMAKRKKKAPAKK